MDCGGGKNGLQDSECRACGDTWASGSTRDCGSVQGIIHVSAGTAKGVFGDAVGGSLGEGLGSCRGDEVLFVARGEDAWGAFEGRRRGGGWCGRIEEHFLGEGVEEGVCYGMMGWDSIVGRRRRWRRKVERVLRSVEA